MYIGREALILKWTCIIDQCTDVILVLIEGHCLKIHVCLQHQIISCKSRRKLTKWLLMRVKTIQSNSSLHIGAFFWFVQKISLFKAFNGFVMRLGIFYEGTRFGAVLICFHKSCANALLLHQSSWSPHKPLHLAIARPWEWSDNVIIEAITHAYDLLVASRIYKGGVKYFSGLNIS